MESAGLAPSRAGVDLVAARRNKQQVKGAIARRAFDIVGALFCLAIFSPVILLLALGVALSGGRVLFAHERLGLDGRRFRCLKFRSMRVDAADHLEAFLARNPGARREWNLRFKLKNDPRITRFGAFLRRTSLDELPQLWNVLRGEMRLVGPRPIVEEELSRYGRYASYYLSARPGMTGLWQISGRSDTSYCRRVALDYAYVRNQCVMLDLRILLLTVPVVLGIKSGAC